MEERFLIIGYDAMFTYDEVIKEKKLINFIADKKHIYFDNRKRDDNNEPISRYGGVLTYDEVEQEDIDDIMKYRVG